MTIPISIWSDIACPWCFVGKANLDGALQELTADNADLKFQIRWRAFELDPTPREPSTQKYVDRLAAKYQRTTEQAQEMLDNMSQAIRAAGGEADFDTVIAANTFDAHRLIQWAGDLDRSGATEKAQHRLTEGFMRGYLGQGLNLADNNSMLKLVAALDLDDEAAAHVLASDRFADVVRADEQAAVQHGIRGVPFFVIGNYGLSGAQPSTALIEAVRQVQSDQAAAAGPLDTE
ncbi:MAG: DsbA family oxidoreductase [Gammaproteobacteria bacterium]